MLGKNCLNLQHYYTIQEQINIGDFTLESRLELGVDVDLAGLPESTLVFPLTVCLPLNDLLLVWAKGSFECDVDEKEPFEMVLVASTWLPSLFFFPKVATACLGLEGCSFPEFLLSSRSFCDFQWFELSGHLAVDS